MNEGKYSILFGVVLIAIPLVGATMYRFFDLDLNNPIILLGFLGIMVGPSFFLSYKKNKKYEAMK